MRGPMQRAGRARVAALVGLALLVGIVVTVGLLLRKSPTLPAVDSAPGPNEPAAEAPPRLSESVDARREELPPPQLEPVTTEAATEVATAGAIFGTVRSSTDGRGVSARVWARNLGAYVTSVRADAEGRFEFKVAEYSTEVQVTHRAYTPARFDLATCPRREDGGFDLVLTPATLTPVRFVDEEGNPLSGSVTIQGKRTAAADLRATFCVQPVAIGARMQHSRASTEWIVFQSRFEGPPEESFDLAPDIAGVLAERRPLEGFVVAVAEGHCISEAQPYVAERLTTLTVVESALSASLASLRFRVLDDVTGRPPRVFAYSIAGSLSNGGVPADGIVLETGLVGSSTILRVFAPGFGDHCQHVDLVGGGETDLGDIRLYPARRIHGRVLDETGAPVVGLQVGVVDAAILEDPAQQEHQVARTDGSGEFVVQNKATGVVAISVAAGHKGYAPVAELVDLRDGLDREVEIRVLPSRWCRVLLAAPQERLLRWRVRNPGGPMLAAGWLEAGDRFAVRLGKGEYVVRFHDTDDKFVGEASFDVPDAQRSSELLIRPDVVWKQ